MRVSLRALAVFIILVLLGAVIPAAQAQTDAGESVLLKTGDAAGEAWLRSTGGLLLADYGAYSLWAVTLRDDIPQGLRRVETRLDFRGLEVDGAEPLLPPLLRASPAGEGGKRLWLVQFAGPLQDSWLDVLRSGGQEVVSCLGGEACLLWGESFYGSLGQAANLIRWQGEFHPAYRLHPDLRPGGTLRTPGGEVEVTLQFLAVPEAQAALARLRMIATWLEPSARPVLNFLNIRASLPVERLDEAAALAPLVNIEPYHPPQLMDELQAQIMAGNISLVGSSYGSPQDYLAWLGETGLPVDPAAYPILDVADDGIDQGDAAHVLHPDFYQLGDPGSPDRIAYLQSCLTDLSSDGVSGHGNLNAGIASGYNNQGGFPYTDARGLFSSFRYGLGVSPFGRLAGTKVFNNDGYWDVSRCGGSYTGLVQQMYRAGARLSNNSWADPSARGAYTADAQEYDALTRDADPVTVGNQEMLHVFSAGNTGGAGSIGAPGTAKNVLTVGATNFPRAGGSAVDLAWYSSRGPTTDLRAKPDLVAPGSFIQGPASLDSQYDGSSVFARYYPPGQSLYTYSYGTSHSAPAVAGAAQLVYADYAAAHGGVLPSPALVKAVLIHSARYLDGLDTGGNLPAYGQGWGMPDLARTLSDQPVLLSDQVVLFTGSGESHSWQLTLPEAAEDLRVTLVWSDAPGLPVGPALVNDLDLEVVADGFSYLGNNFVYRFSVTGGSADQVNNVESVFLPVSRFGRVQIRVTAVNIAGDGVPGNSDLTDQDFALVVSSRRGYVYYYPQFFNQSPFPSQALIQ